MLADRAGRVSACVGLSQRGVLKAECAVSLVPSRPQLDLSHCLSASHQADQGFGADKVCVSPLQFLVAPDDINVSLVLSGPFL